MWLKRPANLTERQRDLLDELLAQPLQTVRAYTLAQQFDSFYELTDPDTAKEYLRRWIAEVDRSDLAPLQMFARMLEDHWLGVIRSQTTHPDATHSDRGGALFCRGGAPNEALCVLLSPPFRHVR